MSSDNQDFFPQSFTIYSEFKGGLQSILQQVGELLHAWKAIPLTKTSIKRYRFVH